MQSLRKGWDGGGGGGDGSGGRAGGMSQWLGAHAVFAEDLSSFHSTGRR